MTAQELLLYFDLTATYGEARRYIALDAVKINDVVAEFGVDYPLTSVKTIHIGKQLKINRDATI